MLPKCNITINVAITTITAHEQTDLVRHGPQQILMQAVPPMYHVAAKPVQANTSIVYHKTCIMHQLGPAEC